ncbi:GNAT family N-acetyltransferase [Ruegeria pomeroyi]|uniref:Acetyltransferase, GNAT family n=2 Tax=Ruegeria pomeroyi TaxID=89184 RepID=Q5LNL9_RUEPO|nr:GNAT family protein [Ruegeria pomeroyi]HCE71230.1 N-acetyltransferase [Ruegeria sp.]AAV96419.1 acetyltransferase, GNAT family [Ruegeria pomeroyi DSS-3]NVK95652.1 GNAT family N-acetyltransferase [Ruegeria pomeroyi]NVL01312.1 GNAT family N-acetyltransferase [Ruegeria pomeroyi]QWV09966.1 GNAT family N-acetyltransferase [Ruegeria pomeroyi]
MAIRRNELGQPIGAALPHWRGCPRPERQRMEGSFARLEPLSAARHGADLWHAFAADTEGHGWTYLPFGPFDDQAGMTAFLEAMSKTEDPLYFAICDRASGRAQGIASYMRIQPEHGVIEVGGIAFAPVLQRSRMATEAMFLMMAHAFDTLGYRRYEWKCDALNAPSRRAAERFGFSYDGRFEQAIVYKGRNRDTAWYSILNRDWPKLRQRFVDWLAPENFTSDGQQRNKLGVGRA